MQIPEIRARLPLARVLSHYGWTPDARGRMRCPFHDDKTPSLQTYPDTGTVYCFAGGCPTHGKSLDVIDIIKQADGCTKHEAIVRAKAMAGGLPAAAPTEAAPSANRTAADDAARRAVLQRMWAYFCAGAPQSGAAVAYLRERGLDLAALTAAGAAVGYNSGQFHHGSRRDAALIASCVRVGLLAESAHRAGPDGAPTYRVFGLKCLAFALRDAGGHVAGLYFRRATATGKKGAGRHFYLKDRRGLYPRWPASATRRLLVCESVVDAASVAQDGRLAGAWSVLALYGTNGWTAEHDAAVAALEHLEEVCLLLDADAAGRAATGKLAAELRARYPELRVTAVVLPEGQDANAVVVAGGAAALAAAIEAREEVATVAEGPSSSTEPPAAGEVNEVPEPEPPAAAAPDPTPGPAPEPSSRLDEADAYDLGLRGRGAAYRIKGLRPGQGDSLKVTLRIARPTDADPAVTNDAITLKLDLYDYREVERTARLAAERLGLDAAVVATDLAALTAELEGYRRRRRADGAAAKAAPVAVSAAAREECLALLRAPGLMARINEHIGGAGIVGEGSNRLVLFTVASSYKMPDTMHALIQGSSGSGKTRLLHVIASCMPPEDLKRYTRVTEHALYNQAEDFFTHKLVCFEDLDAIGEDALLSVRELQSNEVLTSVVSVKDERGGISGGERVVRGPIASLACTTRGEVYEDNVSRSIVVAVDESREQTLRVVAFQDARAAGLHTRGRQASHRDLLANCVRLLEPREVVNPYAGRVRLPDGAHKLRRLHELYLSFVRQVCLLHQYQRETDAGGRLVATVEDLRLAAEVLFEAIVLKVDELDGSVRQFYERLKGLVGDDAAREFTQREVRVALHVSGAHCSRAFARLEAAEYLTAYHAGNLRRKCYRLCAPDDHGRLRREIKAALDAQIDALESGSAGAGVPEGGETNATV